MSLPACGSPQTPHPSSLHLLPRSVHSPQLFACGLVQRCTLTVQELLQCLHHVASLGIAEIEGAAALAKAEDQQSKPPALRQGIGYPAADVLKILLNPRVPHLKLIHRSSVSLISSPQRGLCGHLHITSSHRAIGMRHTLAAGETLPDAAATVHVHHATCRPAAFAASTRPCQCCASPGGRAASCSWRAPDPLSSLCLPLLRRHAIIQFGNFSTARQAGANHHTRVAFGHIRHPMLCVSLAIRA